MNKTHKTAHVADKKNKFRCATCYKKPRPYPAVPLSRKNAIVRPIKRP